MANSQPVIKLRCLLQREEGLYVAHCIDFNLACQADSEDEAKQKMHAMIMDYLASVFEIAREGDLRSAKQLLARKSAWDIRLRYYAAAGLEHMRAGMNALGRPWREAVCSPITA